MDDEKWMRLCLKLALGGKGRTSPNPMVGAVVLDKSGECVGVGYHEKLGAPHAEPMALRDAGRRARGGTLYVNLEPCRHVQNRRTEPCAPMLLEAGIRRLVFGLGDPIPGHRGGGNWLRKQGLEVTRGVLAKECRELNRAFFTWAVEDRPFYVLKTAMSLDGQIATRSGESKWISSSKARAHGRVLRGELDGILVGIETVLADDPQLTTRTSGGRDPVRIVLDAGLRTPLAAKLLPKNGRSRARVLIFATEQAPEARARGLRARGAEVIRVGSSGKRKRPGAKKARVSTLLDLHEVSAQLAERGLTSVLVEGGATVHGSFLDAGLCDELRVYVAPKALGPGGKTWLGGAGVSALAKAHKLSFADAPERIGEDLLLIAKPR